MTEREKMLTGKIYKPFGDGLAGERTLAHKLCAEYNQRGRRAEKGGNFKHPAPQPCRRGLFAGPDIF